MESYLYMPCKAFDRSCHLKSLLVCRWSRTLYSRIVLEETGYMPVEKYTRAPEILEHSRRIGEKWNLYPRTIFQTSTTDVAWDDSVKKWIIKTDQSDVIKARFVIAASGPLTKVRWLPMVL